MIDHLKKPEMAKQAERLLTDMGWLPEPLRTTDAQIGSGNAESEVSTDALRAFLADAEDGSLEDPSDAEEPSHFQLLKPGSLRRAFFVTAQRTASEPAVLKVRGRPERV